MEPVVPRVIILPRFRIYRNPRGEKKGQELADAVVVFDDVVLMVQVKAQCGNHEAKAWATEKLLERAIPWLADTRPPY
jgi:hypothetical protein